MKISTESSYNRPQLTQVKYGIEEVTRSLNSSQVSPSREDYAIEEAFTKGCNNRNNYLYPFRRILSPIPLFPYSIKETNVRKENDVVFEMKSFPWLEKLLCSSFSLLSILPSKPSIRVLSSYIFSPISIIFHPFSS